MQRGILALACACGFSLFGFTQEQASPRNIFMSTTGSVIEYKEYKDKEDKKGDRTQVRKKSKKAEASAQQYLGMELQVLIPHEGGLRPIDPKKHVFRTGDRFKVKILYNSPGVVDFYNENPKGEINHLGRWVVENAFSGTLLPNQGWFSFVDKKGKEKLIVYFYPCKPQDMKVMEEIHAMYSRDIQVIRDDNLSGLGMREDTYASLPLCDFSKKEEQAKNYKSSSRNIVYMEEKTTKRVYYFMPLVEYNANTKPIVAVLEFIHR